MTICELFDLKLGLRVVGARMVVILRVNLGLVFKNTACRNFQTAVCIHEKVVF